MKKLYFLFSSTIILFFGAVLNLNAQNNVVVSASDNWVGYMNVFDLAGNYQFGSGWGVADLKTTTDVVANTITLQPNFNTYADNPGDPYWQNGAIGNKLMDASTYVEPGASFNGADLTFSGTVTSNTIDLAQYSAKYFIKALDPNAGYSDALGGSATFDLPLSGNFSVTVPAASLSSGFVVQYGFVVNGINANPSDELTIGSVVVSAAVSQSPSDLFIQGITEFSTPAGGSSGKSIHLKANASISDLSAFGIGLSFNGNGSNGQDYALPSVSLNSGDDVVIVNDSSGYDAYMNTCMSEFEHIFIYSSLNFNGDDAVELFYNNAVTDIYGDNNVDGTGELWEYTDAWAYRNTTGPSTTFSVSDWTIPSILCTSGSTTTQTSSCPYPICVSPPPADLIITAEVCGNTGGSVVRMTGPFWNWDPLAGPTAVDNGDGTYTFTLSPAPTADMEYLFILDGVQENLISSMANGGSCAPVTDFSSYANRLWTVGDPDVTGVVYGQCDPCTPPADLIITAEVCGNTGGSVVRMTGPFWNWDPLAGPTAVDNGDGTYTFTLSPAPTADMEYLFILDGVQENLISSMANGGSCAPVTDFSSYANRLWTVGDPDVTGVVYGQCDPCTPPADLIITAEVCGNTGGSVVRMTGPFWNWDPLAGPTAVDNGDGTYTFTLSPAPTADMEYLFILDGVQENLISSMANGGSCAPVTDFSSYANRLWTVGDPDVTGVVYGQCDPCTPPADLIITAEVCGNTGGSVVRMTGPFWNWDPLAGPTAVDNGDGTYTFTLSPAPTADMEYLFILDGVQENLISSMANGGSCAPVTDFSSYANRLWTVGDPDVTGVVYGQCDPCTPPADLIITAEVCGNTGGSVVRMTGPFWNWDPLAGPTAVDNGDGTYTFTLSPAPTADMEYLFILDGVQENLISSMANGGSCAPVTDFSSYANRLWTVGDPDVTGVVYGQCDPCTPPADLIITAEVCGNTGGSVVRMTGPFWNWDPLAGPTAVDNGDGTYTFTLSPAPTADMEYLFILDGVQENLISSMANGGSCAPVTDFSSYANRLWTVGDPDVTGVVYGQCDPCSNTSVSFTELDSFSVYPNPSKGILNITSLVGIDNVVVRDLLGRNVFELKNVSVSNLTINLKEFSNDIYFVELNKGQHKEIKKLIIMK